MAATTPKQAVSVFQEFRAMFYVLGPNESSFRSVEEVPDYVDKATPLFITLVLLEVIIKWAQKKHFSFLHSDDIASLSAGIFSRIPDVISRSVEISAYIYVWNNYRMLELPWDSSWTWFLTFIGVDFGYYWFHRMAHEINFLWAGHQAHHSSEHYNLLTALRQSILQKFTSWIFYLPLALCIPPSIFAVHLQFNLLYQFWIHTEVIENLGPLEFILNTPSHHRVHHGRNRYCIDKNYGGTLIIWDRIFGTFAAEKDKVVYGLTHPINTFESLKVQVLGAETFSVILCACIHKYFRFLKNKLQGGKKFHHCVYIWSIFWTTPGFVNKLSVMFKGPGWAPGKPRLGLIEEIPEITGKEVPFNRKLPSYMYIYVIVHFALMMGFYVDLTMSKYTLSQVTLLLRVGYIVLTLTSIGFLMDQRPEMAFMESARCYAFLALQKFGYLEVHSALLSSTYEVLFFLCMAFWGIQIIKQLTSSRAKQH